MTDIGEFIRTLDADRVWAALGLKGCPSRSCQCPFHDDRNASFSVRPSRVDQRAIWKCYAGCGQGDLLDLWVKATGMSKSDALRELRKASLGRVAPPPLKHQMGVEDKIKKPRDIGDFGDAKDIAALSKLRGIPADALNLAIERGILRFWNRISGRTWLVRDFEGLAISVRPLKESRWKNGLKVEFERDSQADHMIGRSHVPEAELVFVCEGGPDLLAAHAVILRLEAERMASRELVAAVAMLSAGAWPTETSCKAMKGKDVVIWAHSDLPGLKAAESWSGLFQPFARAVHTIQAADLVPGMKDLNDVIRDPSGMDAVISAIRTRFGTTPVA
jgi:hypothetical protein